VIEAGGTAIFEELGELFGCEEHMAARALTPALGQEIKKAMAKATRHYAALDQSSFGGGNITGGLSTIEEKSIGAYAKSGTKPIAGLLKPGVLPPRPGLYLMDMVPDDETKWGFANINDNATIVEQIACGAHIVLFSTGRGSVVGSAIAPVIKICANPETYRRLAEDMDVDAGRILEGRGTLQEVGQEIFDRIQRVAAGDPTRSEALGHQEFILGYKSFEPLGPSCLPM
jgi:altronate dehydratase large subunit